MSNWPKGNLTDAEWLELAALDYILIWEYTDDYQRDLKRCNELSKKRFDSLIYPTQQH